MAITLLHAYFSFEMQHAWAATRFTHLSRFITNDTLRISWFDLFPMSGKEHFPDIRMSGTQLLKYQRTGLRTFVTVLLIIGTAFAFFATLFTGASNPGVLYPRSPQNPSTYNYSKPVILSHCAALKTTPRPPQDFLSREESDRFEPGTNATLIRNCVIFTGKDNGTEVIHGDILLDKGVIKGLGKISGRVIDDTPNLTIIDAKHAWVTPGLIDLHSHLGVLSAPITAGAISCLGLKLDET